MAFGQPGKTSAGDLALADTSACTGGDASQPRALEESSPAPCGPPRQGC